MLGLNEVSYVGYTFPKKIKAISEIPPPEDKPALQRFLGMVNYKFIPNLSDLTPPLHAFDGLKTFHPPAAHPHLLL